MASADVTAIDAILKLRNSPRRLKYVGYQNNPFFALCPKDTGFGGNGFKIPIWYGGNQGGSHVFATAQANKTAGLYKAFTLTRMRDYGLSSIDLEALMASEGDEDAFIRAATAEVDNTLRNVGRNCAIRMYRNVGGARGVIGAISSGSLTLSNINDVTNFEVGMKVRHGQTDGTSGSLEAEAAITITGINRSTGVLTAAAWTGFDVANYLFREGDFGVSMAGLDSWLPSATPASTAFFGVDRTSDSRLYGLTHDGSAQTIKEALEDADSKACREGANPTHVLLNHKDWNDFRKSLGAFVEYDVARSPDMASVSFTTLKLQGANGPVQIVADRNCPQGVAYMLQIDSWVLATLGTAPKILEGLGNKFIWDYNADSIEVRTGYYGNLGCYAPGMNVRITLPA